MPAHRTLKERAQERDTALYPHWYFHQCSECSCFYSEYKYGREPVRKNFCIQWDRKVNPDQYARSCFVFRRPKGTIPILLSCLREQMVDPRPFTWKKGICKWDRREFYYKQYHPNDIRRYCNDYCRWQFKHFLKKIKKNSQLMRPAPQVGKTERDQSSQHVDHCFSVFWGTQSATGPKSSVSVKLPIWISYSVERRFFARYCFLSVVSYSSEAHD
jgi:hypothetical protein